MIFALFNAANEVTGFATGVTEANEATKDNGGRYESRWDWKSLEVVEALAAKLTAVTGDLYLGQDKGRHTSPRFDIYKAPKIGDEVSMGFNGDYYPCGKIATISKTMKKITTTNGTVFYRRGTGACWLNAKTFAMIPGVHDERNPHF